MGIQPTKLWNEQALCSEPGWQEVEVVADSPISNLSILTFIKFLKKSFFFLYFILNRDQQSCGVLDTPSVAGAV